MLTRAGLSLLIPARQGLLRRLAMWVFVAVTALMVMLPRTRVALKVINHPLPHLLLDQGSKVTSKEVRIHQKIGRKNEASARAVLL